MTNIDKLNKIIKKLGFYHPEIHIHDMVNDSVRVHVFVDRDNGTNFVADGLDTEDAAQKVLDLIREHIKEIQDFLDKG